MSLRAWYCGDDEEEEEEEKKREEEEDEDEDDDDDEEEDEEWKVSRPGKGAVPLGPGGPVPAATSGRSGCLQVPAVRTAITEAQAADIVGGTPQQFGAFVQSELTRWPEVVKVAGIKPE